MITILRISLCLRTLACMSRVVNESPKSFGIRFLDQNLDHVALTTVFDGFETVHWYECGCESVTN